MLSKLVPALAAFALLAPALPALASDATLRHDDTTYPETHATFATGVDAEPIVTADVTYPGPHAVLVKTPAPAAAAGALAMFDDTAYPTADAPASAASASAERLANRAAPEATPCTCCGG
jgi:hypothetical protein